MSCRASRRCCSLSGSPPRSRRACRATTMTSAASTSSKREAASARDVMRATQRRRCLVRRSNATVLGAFRLSRFSSVRRLSSHGSGSCPRRSTRRSLSGTPRCATEAGSTVALECSSNGMMSPLDRTMSCGGHFLSSSLSDAVTVHWLEHDLALFQPQSKAQPLGQLAWRKERVVSRSAASDSRA